ncbi:MAG TPA: energy transducer TonB [Terriglobales bacterium]|nr:energy transducer TonB [Terriglobales bacterium]
MRFCTAVAAVFLLLAQALAADPPKAPDLARNDKDAPVPELKIRPAAPVNIQNEAEALLERARHLSDIRGPGSPPFRLKVSFTFIGDELETFAGTYTEYWESDSKWRKEIVVGARKRIEVASGTKLWTSDSDPMLPEKADHIKLAAGVFPSRTVKLEFGSIDAIPGDQGTRCAVTKPVGPHNGKSAVCFDQAHGALVEYIVPQWTRYHLTDFACSYADFRKFGGQWYPFAMDCRVAQHRQMEAHVTELASENPDDAHLFDPPAGAMELGWCAAGAIAPKPDYTPAPLRPTGMGERRSPVTLRMVVDAKGKPQDIRVISPPDKAVDEMAIGTVERWRFKPATCDGEPMAQRVEFEIGFRSY